MSKKVQKQSLSLRETYTPTLRKNRPVHYDGNAIRLPASEIEQVHYHEAVELGVCTQGSGIFLCRDHMEPISQGDAILILPEVRHYSKSLDNCRCRFLYVDLMRVLAMLGLGDGPLSDRITGSSALDIPLILREREYPRLNALIRNAVNEYVNAEYAIRKSRHLLTDPEAAGPLLQAYTYLGLRVSEIMLLCGDRFMPADRGTAEHTVLLPAVEHISLHFDEHITAEELADLCHISLSTLRRRFLAEYGLTPFDYLTEFRCRTAAMMLIHTALSVGEIAERVGYKDDSDFYRNFIAWKHQSPSGFRKTHKSGAGNGRKNK